jgi:hypothetical protein
MGYYLINYLVITQFSLKISNRTICFINLVVTYRFIRTEVLFLDVDALNSAFVEMTCTAK